MSYTPLPHAMSLAFRAAEITRLAGLAERLALGLLTRDDLTADDRRNAQDDLRVTNAGIARLRGETPLIPIDEVAA